MQPPASDLELVFSEQVQILTIDFEQVDSNDESALVVDGNQVAFGFIEQALGMRGANANCDVWGDPDECRVSLDVSGKSLIGTAFHFRNGLPGLGRYLDYNDDFRIEAIKFKKLGGTTQVPEPSAALLFSVGALGTGAALRRRRA